MTRSLIRRPARRLAALGVCLPVLLGACSKSSDTAATNDQSTTTTVAGAVNAGPTIEIPALQFSPPTATAKVGQVVTWQNKSASTHQVQAVAEPGQPPAFESELVKPDQQYVFTPTAPGTYAYVCRIHPSQMTGTLTVSP
ncbi:MAG: cupredoxin domain-containing protein [Actinobacteria bacterium]|nr:cupredoxin domain-containing protein [Actinomycetota bacterium]